MIVKRLEPTHHLKNIVQEWLLPGTDWDVKRNNQYHALMAGTEADVVRERRLIQVLQSMVLQEESLLCAGEETLVVDCAGGAECHLGGNVVGGSGGADYDCFLNVEAIRMLSAKDISQKPSIMALPRKVKSKFS